ncbi:uncharacterized protein EI90DRAFT_2500769 [Cantharellus anzutake]|uniref:uncharacterized protein n=1 Tax=Cantharellus anzutake TaxID=1750568 RepID=UPI0019056182|nr:uncharacterized protein EI90DRAFT_2500769 [Cantharellus anzutake]KAF8321860.1 hypothetical protein EI90DRAFT_2500769 [Cantharellus anzutake]
MPSRCFVCRLRGKGCTESLDSRPCDPCSRMCIECIACPMAIPSVVKRSARARECLLEVKRLAEPGHTGIARLPKTRKLLLDLQPILGDSTNQSATDEGNPAEPTVTLAITTPHILGNHEPSGLPHALASTTTAFPANYIGTASAVDEPPNVFLMGSPGEDLLPLALPCLT